MSMMQQKMTRDELWLALHDYLQRQPSLINITEFNFHENILSPVRQQGDVPVCAIVSTVTCVEMICRKLGVEIKNCPDYYFNLDDIHDNIDKIYKDLKKPEGQVNEDGFKVSDVMKYIKEYGLQVTSVAMDPQPKNIYSKFCDEFYRQKIFSFERLNELEAFELSNHYPIVVGLDSYTSFNHYDKIMYNGPKTNERLTGSHGMVVVGNATLTMNKKVQRYFIMQNSWGLDYGYKGFVMLWTNLKKLGFQFWIPIVTENMSRSLSTMKSTGSGSDKRVKKKRLHSRQVQVEESVVGSTFAHESAFEDLDGQKKKWLEVYCGLCPSEALEYDDLLHSDINLEPTICFDFDPRPQFQKASTPPASLGEGCCHPPDNNSEHLDHLDSTCCLPVNDEIRCSGAEAEHSPVCSSDANYCSIQKPAFLATGGPDFDSGPPQDGLEYLRCVSGQHVEESNDSHGNERLKSPRTRADVKKRERKKWLEVYCGLCPSVALEYDDLLHSDINLEPTICFDFDPRPQFQKASTPPASLGEDCCHPPDNNSEHLDHLDSTCCLPVNDEIRCSGAEEEHSPFYSSDEDYSNIQKPAFLATGEPDFGSGPPQDGLEYLRRLSGQHVEESNDSQGNERLKIPRTRADENTVKKREKKPRRRRAKLRKNKDTTNCVITFDKKEKKGLIYSRKEMEALRFEDLDGQKKKWLEVYCGLCPSVALEYDLLHSDINLEPTICFDFDPRPQFQNASTPPASLYCCHSPDNNSIHLDHLDSICCLPVNDEIRCSGAEEEHSPFYSSDEDYSNIQKPAFLATGEPDFGSGPPQDGLEYLRRLSGQHVESNNSQGDERLMIPRTRADENTVKKREKKPRRRRAKLRKNKDTTNCVITFDKKEKKGLIYSRKEMEALRFEDFDCQKKKWLEVYCGLCPSVALEYDDLLHSDNNLGPTICFDFDPRPQFQKASTLAASLGEDCCHPPDNNSEHLDHLDSTCCLPVNDERRCSGSEEEYSPVYSSDKDYSSIQKPAFLATGEPDFDSSPPQDGLDYLRHVSGQHVEESNESHGNERLKSPRTRADENTVKKREKKPRRRAKRRKNMDMTNYTITFEKEKGLVYSRKEMEALRFEDLDGPKQWLEVYCGLCPPVALEYDDLLHSDNYLEPTILVKPNTSHLPS